MKAFISICVFITGCTALPVLNTEAEILQYDNTQNEKGNYNFSFKTSNEIERSESGTLVHAGQDDEHIEVQGFYSYLDSDGKLVEVRYTADENGFHILPIFVVPQVPASAPVSPAVLASLLG